MSHSFIKKAGLGLVSLSAVVLLAACGDGGTTEEPTTEPGVEEPATDPATDPAEDAATDGGTTDDGAAGGGTTGDGTADDDPTTDTPPSDTPDTSNGIYGVEFAVSLDDAVQTFHDTFGQEVNIDQVEFDEDDGNYEYHISGWDGQNDYELDVDAQTGEITEEETESETETDNTIDFAAIISPQEAMDTAVDTAGSEFVEEWSLEEDDGVTVYEISIENGNDVTLDAETGEVIPD